MAESKKMFRPNDDYVSNASPLGSDESHAFDAVWSPTWCAGWESNSVRLCSTTEPPVVLYL